MLRILKYRYKTLLSERIIIFWALVFPLILSTLFSVAFSNLDNGDIIDTIPVAVVDSKANEHLISNMQVINTNDKPLFEIHKVSSVADGQTLLKSKSVIGVIDEQTLIIKQASIQQTILQSFLNRYLQANQTIYHLMQENQQFSPTTIDFDQTFVTQQNINPNVKNMMVIPFYTVIAMACLYGAFFGLEGAYSVQANLSFQGTRLQVSPYPKWKMVLTDFFCAWSILIVILLIILVYINRVLNIGFGPFLPILLICAIGSALSIILGYLISITLKASANVKTGIIVSVTMIFSFLSGMMSVQVKYFLDQTVPWLKYFNPSALITDSFYRLYYYNDFKMIISNLLVMTAYTIIFTIITMLLLRREQYDNL